MIEDLQADIAVLHPRSIVELGPLHRQIAAQFCTTHNIEYQHVLLMPLERGPTHRCELAIVHAGVHTDADQLPVVIGTLKNYWSDNIWVLSEKTCDPFAEHYLALGFIREKTSNKSDFLRYSYNLDCYNRKRDWNNSKFWANPENWHKRF